MKHIFHALRHRAAKFWLNTVHKHVIQIAVTGSYGKTSTTNAIFEAVSSTHPSVRTDINLDTIYNVPITALQVRPTHRYSIFELGIDSPNEMDFHLRVVRPSISVVTGITPVHSDEKHAGSLEHLIQQKGRIIEVLSEEGTAILNADDPQVDAMAARTSAQILRYGAGERSDYRVRAVRLSLTGTDFIISCPHGEIEVQTGLIGAHNAANLAAAAAVAHLAGLTNDDIRAVFRKLQPLEGRFSVESGPQGMTLIKDSLRANPASTKAGLNFLQHVQTPNRKIAVLGEMGELGDHALSGHREVGITAAQADLAFLITVGDLSQHTAEAARAHGLPADRIHAVQTVHEAAQLLERYGKTDDIIYLKGSLLRHMERIPMILEGVEVGCRVISCPFYHQCPHCRFLLKGYNPDTR